MGQLARGQFLASPEGQLVCGRAPDRQVIEGVIPGRDRKGQRIETGEHRGGVLAKEVGDRKFEGSQLCDPETPVRDRDVAGIEQIPVPGLHLAMEAGEQRAEPGQESFQPATTIGRSRQSRHPGARPASLIVPVQLFHGRQYRAGFRPRGRRSPDTAGRGVPGRPVRDLLNAQGCQECRAESGCALTLRERTATKPGRESGRTRARFGQQVDADIPRCREAAGRAGVKANVRATGAYQSGTVLRQGRVSEPEQGVTPP